MEICHIIARIVLTWFIIGLVLSFILGMLIQFYDNTFINFLVLIICGSTALSAILLILGLIGFVICSIWGIEFPFDWRV